MHRADAETMVDSAFVETLPHLRTDQPRYCTECLIACRRTPRLDLELRRLREGLSALGTSLVVGGNKRKAKLHIHTDDPERVFEFAETFGTLTGQKADDMQRQQSAAHHPKAQRVAIVTDSAADIPEDLLESLGIHVVPLRIHFGNRSYLDKVTMTPTEFYRELAANPEHPKTSQPPPGDFRRMYEFLASHYESVVSIALSAQVSGTCNAATTAAQRIAPGPDGQRRVVVIDSHSASAGEGLVAIAAAECAKAGGSAAAVIATARDAAAHTRAFALLGSVDYAVKPAAASPSAAPLRAAPDLIERFARSWRSARHRLSSPANPGIACWSAMAMPQHPHSSWPNASPPPCRVSPSSSLRSPRWAPH